MLEAYLRFDTTLTSVDTMQLQNHIHDAIGYILDSTSISGDPSLYYHLVNLYIAEQQYDSASSVISAWTTEYPTDTEVTNLASYYGILINGLGNNFSSTWQSTYNSSLVSLAETPCLAEAKAQSLLQYVYDRSFATDSTDTLKTHTILYPPTFEAVSGGGEPENLAVFVDPIATSELIVNAYPNPVTDMLQLDISNATGYSTVLHLTIFDNMGRICVDQIVSAGIDADLSRTIDMSALNKGLYFLKITNNSTLAHNQVIVKQ